MILKDLLWLTFVSGPSPWLVFWCFVAKEKTEESCQGKDVMEYVVDVLVTCNRNWERKKSRPNYTFQGHTIPNTFTSFTTATKALTSSHNIINQSCNPEALLRHIYGPVHNREASIDFAFMWQSSVFLFFCCFIFQFSDKTRHVK